MNTATLFKNWAEGTAPSILENIREKEVNIALYNRNIDSLTNEIKNIMNLGIDFQSSGDLDTIYEELSNALHSSDYDLITKDIKRLLLYFKEVSGAQEFRLLLATVNKNMCRKFHTDINDLRMLCTYSGPGTLWLTEDNVNREALDSCGDNECIVVEESKIRQANTGAVVLLKGAIYPEKGTKAIVHRSPTIEESGEQRLLLRIDTNELWGL
jgi:hypothetical protein